MSMALGPGFETLLEHLRCCRGFDFRGYKRANLTRRVLNRMHAAGVEDFAAYRGYLDSHPEEYTPLFDSIVINVTGFFRDTAAWEYLGRDIVPRLMATSAEGPIRVWSAGCASGQEAYSVAMLCAEAMGLEAFSRRVRMFATDVDEAALTQARAGAYTDEDLEPVPSALRQKYFETGPDRRHRVRLALRGPIIFANQDILRDLPISRVDLLVCRNTLMYFTPESQTEILARFRTALANTGYLFLGKAELIVSHPSVFLPVSLKHHLFAPLLMADAQLPQLDAAADQAVRRMDLPAELAGAAQELSLTLVPATGRAIFRRAPPWTLPPKARAGGLRAAHAELESLHAALEVTNEELETSNAEFQSSNEALGSLNEELHSTNSELGTLNTELHRRTIELSTTIAVLRSILAGLRVGVAVLNRDLTILLWSHEAENLWGFSADAVEHHSLLEPELGLALPPQPIAEFLAGGMRRTELMVAGMHRNGTGIRLRITCTPFVAHGGERAGVVLFMEVAQ